MDGSGAVYVVAVVASEGTCLLEGKAHDAHKEADAVVFVVVQSAARRVGIALGGGGREAGG